MFEFIGENVLLMEIDASYLKSSIFVSTFVLGISACSFISVSNLVVLVMLTFQGGFHKPRIWIKFMCSGVIRVEFFSLVLSFSRRPS